MTATHLVIWAFMILLGATAVIALIWAVSSGQLHNFQAGASCIFDDEEPIGRPTGAFPHASPLESKRDSD